MKCFAAIVLLAIAGLAAAQAPAPAPAPAKGALPPVSWDAQKNLSLPLQTAHCQRSLEFTYQAYSYTGNWTVVPQVTPVDGSSYTFCYSLPPVGQSSNNMKVVLHYTIPLGYTVTQLISLGLVKGVNETTGTANSYEELVALARSVESKDNSYFAGVSTTTAVPYLDVHVLGLVIFGKSDNDLGQKFICSCILNIVNNPSTSSVATQSTPVAAAAAG